MLHLCRNHLMVVWQWKRQTASPRHKNAKWNDFPLSIIYTFHFVTCCQWASAYYQSYDCFNASGSCSYFHSFPSFFFLWGTFPCFSSSSLSMLPWTWNYFQYHHLHLHLLLLSVRPLPRPSFLCCCTNGVRCLVTYNNNNNDNFICTCITLNVD